MGTGGDFDDGLSRESRNKIQEAIKEVRKARARNRKDTSSLNVAPGNKCANWEPNDSQVRLLDAHEKKLVQCTPSTVPATKRAAGQPLCLNERAFDSGSSRSEKPYSKVFVKGKSGDYDRCLPEALTIPYKSETDADKELQLRRGIAEMTELLNIGRRVSQFYVPLGTSETTNSSQPVVLGVIPQSVAASIGLNTRTSIHAPLNNNESLGHLKHKENVILTGQDNMEVNSQFSSADQTLAKPKETVVLIPKTAYTQMSNSGNLAEKIETNLCVPGQPNKYQPFDIKKTLDGSFKIARNGGDPGQQDEIPPQRAAFGNEDLLIVTVPDSISWHCNEGRSRSGCEARFRGSGEDCYWTGNHAMHSQADVLISDRNVIVPLSNMFEKGNFAEARLDPHPDQLYKHMTDYAIVKRGRMDRVNNGDLVVPARAIGSTPDAVAGAQDAGVAVNVQAFTYVEEQQRINVNATANRLNGPDALLEDKAIALFAMIGGGAVPTADCGRRYGGPQPVSADPMTFDDSSTIALARVGDALSISATPTDVGETFNANQQTSLAKFIARTGVAPKLRVANPVHDFRNVIMNGMKFYSSLNSRWTAFSRDPNRRTWNCSVWYNKVQTAVLVRQTTVRNGIFSRNTAPNTLAIRRLSNELETMITSATEGATTSDFLDGGNHRQWTGSCLKDTVEAILQARLQEQGVEIVDIRTAVSPILVDPRWFNLANLGGAEQREHNAWLMDRLRESFSASLQTLVDAYCLNDEPDRDKVTTILKVFERPITINDIMDHLDSSTQSPAARAALDIPSDLNASIEQADVEIQPAAGPVVTEDVSFTKWIVKDRDAYNEKDEKIQKVSFEYSRNPAWISSCTRNFDILAKAIENVTGETAPATSFHKAVFVRNYFPSKFDDQRRDPAIVRYDAYPQSPFSGPRSLTLQPVPNSNQVRELVGAMIGAVEGAETVAQRALKIPAELKRIKDEAKERSFSMAVPVIDEDAVTKKKFVNIVFVNDESFSEQSDTDVPNKRSLNELLRFSQTNERDTNKPHALTGTVPDPLYAFRSEGDGKCVALVGSSTVTRPMTDNDLAAINTSHRVPKAELDDMYYDKSFHDPRLGSAFHFENVPQRRLSGTQTPLGRERRVYMGATPSGPRPLRGNKTTSGWMKQYLVDSGDAWEKIHQVGTFRNITSRLDEVTKNVAVGFMEEEEFDHVMRAVVDICNEYGLWGYLADSSGLTQQMVQKFYADDQDVRGNYGTLITSPFDNKEADTHTPASAKLAEYIRNRIEGFIWDGQPNEDIAYLRATNKNAVK
ncbi:MAG: hypothetical protein CL902_01175, partial [Dehalococcoidia bacterium]|nr:hypothetical protein [Dehalococcoidia bacterium]